MSESYFGFFILRLLSRLDAPILPAVSHVIGNVADCGGFMFCISGVYNREFSSVFII